MKPDEDHKPSEPRIDLAREPDFALGAIYVRPSSREVTVSDRSMVLEPRVMQVLVVLAGAYGVVVSRDELMQRCWDGRAVGDDAINRCIAKVRALAKSDPARSFSIETIRGVGYRLTTAPAEGVPAHSHARIYAAAIVLGPALLLLAAWYWWPD